MMTKQRNSTRRARSKRGPRMSTTVEYKMAVMLFRSLYIFCMQYLFLM